MEWFKMSAEIGSNAKVGSISDRAFRALVNCWAWAMQQESGGRLPAQAAQLIPRVRDDSLRELEQAGLLEANGDSGWAIHDWAEHQALALDWQERRERDAARKRAERSYQRRYTK